MNAPQIVAPSGRVFHPEDIDLLREAHGAGTIVYSEKPFTLKSKIQSHVYVFARGDITDSPSLLYRCGQKIARTVQDNIEPGDHQPCLIGLPTAGTALAVAASMASLRATDMPMACRVMREERKKSHGASKGKWVNGERDGPPNLEKFTFWPVDNVTTDGETKFEAAVRFEEDGYPSKEMPQLIFVDRQQGAVKRLSDAGFKRIVVCYYLLDITYLYAELGLWPKDVVKKVEDEIAAHQFVTA